MKSIIGTVSLLYLYFCSFAMAKLPNEPQTPEDYAIAGVVVVGVGLIALFLVWLCFLPTSVAFRRGMRNRWIVLVLNVFLIPLFASIIPWVILLIWAASGRTTEDEKLSKMLAISVAQIATLQSQKPMS